MMEDDSSGGLDIVVVADVGGPGPDERWHIGDEAMLASNLALFGDQQLRRISVVSTAPEATGRIHEVDALQLPSLLSGEEPAAGLAGLEASLRPDSAGRSADLAQAIANTDVVWFSGAGNLTSVFRDRLLERVAIGRAARAAGARVVLTGQTLGPDLDGIDRSLVRELLHGAEYVGIRDAASQQLAYEMGVAVSRQLDDAFTFSDDVMDQPGGHSYVDGRPVIGVTLHQSPAGGPRFDVGLAAARLDELASALDATVVFIPHFSDVYGKWADAHLMAEVGDALATSFAHLTLGTPYDAVRAILGCSLVVSTRYHPIVFGLRCGVPSLGLVQDRYHEAKLIGATAPYGRSAWVLPIAALVEPGVLVAAGAKLVTSDQARLHLGAANAVLGHRAAAERRARSSVVLGIGT